MAHVVEIEEPCKVCGYPFRGCLRLVAPTATAREGLFLVVGSLWRKGNILSMKFHLLLGLGLPCTANIMFSSFITFFSYRRFADVTVGLIYTF